MAPYAPILFALVLGLLQCSQACTSSTAITCVGTHLPNTSSTGDLYCASIPNSVVLGGDHGLVNCSGGSWVPLDVECTCFYSSSSSIESQLVNNQCGVPTCASGTVFTTIPVGESICGPGDLSAGYTSLIYQCARPGYAVARPDLGSCGTCNENTTFTLSTPPPAPVTAPPNSLNCNSSVGFTTCLGTPIPVPQYFLTEACLVNPSTGVTTAYVCNSVGTWSTLSQPCNCPYLAPPADLTDGIITTSSCRALACNGTGVTVPIGTSVCSPNNVWLTCLGPQFFQTTTTLCTCSPVTLILTNPPTTTAAPTTTPEITTTASLTTTSTLTTTTVPATTTTRTTTITPTLTLTTTNPITTSITSSRSTTTLVSTVSPTTVPGVPTAAATPNPKAPFCINVPIVGQPFPVCPDLAVVPLSGCFMHPTTHLIYLSPPERAFQKPASGTTTQGPVYCFGAPSASTRVSGTLPPYPDINPLCNCQGIVSGQVQEGTTPWQIGTGICNGDGLYCASLNSTWTGPGQCTDGAVGSTTSGTGCVCLTDTRNYTTVQQQFIGGSWVVGIPFACLTFGTPVEQVNLIRNVPLFGYHPSDMRRRSEPRAASTQVSLEAQTLIVITPQPNDTRVSVVKDGVSALYLCANIQCLILLPDNFFYNSGSLDVKVYIVDILDQEVLLPVSAFINCNIPRCVFCTEMVSDFGCFPVEFQAFVVICIIAACLLIIFILYRLFCGNKSITCCKGCGKTVVNKFKEKWGKMRNRPASTGGSDNELASMSVHKVVMLVLLFAPLILAQSCANGITVAVDINQCTTSGTTQTCSVGFSSLLSIPAPGLDACLSFTTPDGGVIGTMNVKYSQMVKVAPLSLQYVTSSFLVTSYSVRECSHTNQMCGSCTNYNPVSDPFACGTLPLGDPGCLIPAWLIGFPGVSQCSSQCGCAGCSCFWCDSACVYSRAVLMPSGPFCELLRPISISLRPQLIVNFTSGGVTQTTPVDVIALDQQVGGNFSLTMTGTLQGSDSFINDERVLQCQDGFSGLGFASLPNAPVAGSIGDIQANSYADVQALPEHVIFDPSIIQSLYTSGATNYVFHSPGMNTRSVYDQFPTLRGSTLWSANGPYMTGIDSSPGAVIFTLSSLDKVVMSRTVNVVCPKITSASISGCYSCDQGSTIDMVAHSRCSAGGVVITATGDCLISSPSSALEVTDTALSIRVTSTVSSPTCVITLTSSIYSDSISVTGTLVRDNLILVTNGTYSSNSTTSGGIGGLDLSGISAWFAGLLDWQKGLFIAGMVVVAIIGTILVVYVVRRAVMSYRAAKVQAQYKALESVPPLK